MGRTPGHLDRIGDAGQRQALSRGVARWRVALAIAIVLAFAGFCTLLAAPYYRNWQLQSYLEGKAFDAATAQHSEPVIRAEIAEKAAALGIPVPPDQIRVTRSRSGVYLEARYSVRVDLALYTVDLHFRPTAGVR